MSIDSEIIEIEFKGPYYWVSENPEQCIHSCDYHRHSGIYLWTIEYEGKELIYYVGQTGRWFSTRMQEHFKEHASGGYHLYDLFKFRQGQRVSLWPGRYVASQRTTIPEFLERYDEFAPIIKELAGIYRFWLAPVTLETRLRNRLEAAISLPLYDQPGVVGKFQEKGIRYVPRWESEAPMQVVILNRSQFHGLQEILSF